MLRIRTISTAAVIAAAAALLAACGGGSDSTADTSATTAASAATTAADTGAMGGASAGTLTGTVGPGFDISLTQDGQPVTSLTAGTYEIEVSDQSAQHDFHLTGPGVDESTDVGGTGTTTWTVTLEPGEYSYVCDPHASSMNGSFTVG